MKLAETFLCVVFATLPIWIEEIVDRDSWISVDDARKPREHEIVEVLYSCPEVATYDNGKWVQHVNGRCGNVTHWRPLFGVIDEETTQTRCAK